MRFACLVYIDGSAMDGLSEAEGRELTDDSIAFDWGLQRSGRLILAQPLEAPQTAVTIKVREGSFSSTDGPFVEAKEFLGGFFLIEARDRDEAIAVARESPIAKYSSIEIRPLLEQTHSVTGEGRPPVASR